MTNQSDLILITGMWENTSRDGKGKYLSGTFGQGGKLLLFKNTRRENDKQPSHMLYLAPKARESSEASKSTAGDNRPDLYT